MKAAGALQENRVADAKRLVSKFLAARPRDPDALNLMAEIARRARDFEQAEDCLARSIQAAPGHEAYRFNYACVLSDLGKFLPALDQADMLLAKDPENILYLGTKGALLSRVRKFAESADCYRKLTVMCPNSAEAWYGLASALRSIGGNTEESLSALRKLTEIDASLEHAW